MPQAGGSSCWKIPGTPFQEPGCEARLHFLILGADPRLASSWSWSLPTIRSLEQGLLALNSSMVASWGLKQNQAPPGARFTSNWGGEEMGLAPPLPTPWESTLEAHPVA